MQTRQFLFETANGCKAILDKYANGTKFERRFKDPKDLVTSADYELESLIFSRIEKQFPEHRIISEENKRNRLTSEPTWVIDPLDGTNNFAYSIPMYGVSIALVEQKAVKAGCVYLHGDDAFYFAERGKGASKNGKRIRVSKRELPASFALIDSRIHDINSDGRFGGIFDIADAVFGTRMLGAAVYNFAYVADGRADICVELDLKIVDFPAGALIVEEAGGKVTDAKGRPWGMGTRDFIATNGVVHDKILKLLGATK